MARMTRIVCDICWSEGNREEDFTEVTLPYVRYGNEGDVTEDSISVMKMDLCKDCLIDVATLLTNFTQRKY